MRLSVGRGVALAAWFACGCSTQGQDRPGTGSGVDLSGTDGTEAGTADTDEPFSSTTGDADSTGGGCEATCDNGECIDGMCCPIDLACGDTCCGDGEVCSFLQCVVPGDTCVDASECPDAHYCEYALGEPGEMGKGECGGGVSLATGRCLPEPPECEAGQEPDFEALDCLPACEYVPETSFDPVVKFEWAEADIMMPPIVIQLDDDNCDAIVDERDIPEIVLSTFEGGAYNSNGTLRALSVMDGQLVQKWAVNPQTDPVWPGRALAAGNIDGVPGNEIVACTTTGRVRAFRSDGSDLWTSGDVGLCDMPALADLDQDGTVEVIVEGGVLDGVTGALEFAIPVVGSSWWAEHVTAADVTGDGRLDIVTPSRIFDATGAVITTAGPPGTFPAVADLDLDGSPEIVAIHNVNGSGIHHLQVWRWNPAAGGVQIVRQDLDINGTLSPSLCGTGSAGNVGGGGPLTIADFDGDGHPDIGVAGGIGYAVFDGMALMSPAVADAATMTWISQSHDCSSAFTGSSVFDFDGNGSAEVVYADEQYVRIYDGATGNVLLQRCNTSGTLHEYPLVADVDSDGHADIVVVSNSYSSITCPDDGNKTRGLRIFGDAEGKWVRTRRVWNQHAYHVTNVEEDGTVPAVETANWTVPRLNNFRQNVQPEGEFAAPDLVGEVLFACKPDEYELVGRVRNVGRAAVAPGIAVGFYAGDPAAGGTLLGSLTTSKQLYPAEAEDLVLELEMPPPALQNGEVEAWIVVDDGAPPHPWHECRTDNNIAHAPANCVNAG